MGSRGEAPVGVLGTNSSRNWSTEFADTVYRFWLQKRTKFKNFAQFTSGFLASLFHGGAKRHFRSLTPKAMAGGATVQGLITNLWICWPTWGRSPILSRNCGVHSFTIYHRRSTIYMIIRKDRQSSGLSRSMLEYVPGNWHCCCRCRNNYESICWWFYPWRCRRNWLHWPATCIWPVGACTGNAEVSHLPFPRHSFVRGAEALATGQH